ncbi:BZ3500_MvSof-1268-A1-R1_Chr4-2g07195 [Microbotryum saponariae]|uniref:BZ3500_MvSof-1268-A1-R1_Chr4-2g07195 protein n=1 Tax=Microbotryum saponariae TaxID=289078 RepID=A0A2X0KTE7_9BASI|nr:BZ3500_MvSof-1268-A1-R1_Chr4-2g07195 [Microbotryum saponariae]SDA06860.1 BZ3501_MvSof-1269-A2-R1_Chr4-2g06906 [Microbotryum saponariae]
MFDNDNGDDGFDLRSSQPNGTSSSPPPQPGEGLPFGHSSASTRRGSRSGSTSGSGLARFISTTNSADDGLPLPVAASTTILPRTTKRFVASAKGKAKAVNVNDDEAVGQALLNGHDLGEDGERSSSGPTGMAFSIRFTDGSEDLLDLCVGEKESVAEVKRRIRFLRPNLMHEDRPRRLRLIQLGRLLTDGTYLVPWTVQLLSRRAKLVRQQTQPNAEALLEGAIEGIEAAVGVTVPRASIDLKGGSKQDAAHQRDRKGKGKEKDMTLAGTEAENDKQVWLHCSVGEPMDDEEIDSERIQVGLIWPPFPSWYELMKRVHVQTTQITPLQGFDRLRDAGFSEEEIATMRAEFRRNNSAGGDDDEHARALEDQWMEGLTGQNEAAATESTTEGYWMKMLGGLCVGFFFPFLPFFFFRTHLFSRTTQMAIVLGVIINVGFAIMRLFT